MASIAVNAAGSAVAIWAHAEERGSGIWASRFDPQSGWAAATRVYVSHFE